MVFTGMKAGDNTLNVAVALNFLQTMQRVDPQASMDPRELRGHVLEQYVKFMTTPGSHNDTYAESFHRSFFKDWSESKNRPKSAEDILNWTEERWAILIMFGLHSFSHKDISLENKIIWTISNFTCW